jgi:hypothetical protein
VCCSSPILCALTRSPDHSQISSYDALKKAFPKLPDLESFKFMEKEDFDGAFWTAAGIGASHRGDVRTIWAELKPGICCAALCYAMLCCVCGRIHADALTAIDSFECLYVFRRHRTGA